MERVELDTDGEIRVDGRTIGHLHTDENHIEKIEVDYDEQGRGYGTAALRVYLDRIRAQGYRRVSTTPVTSQAMLRVVEKLGFRRVEDPSRHDFLEWDLEKRYRGCFIKEFAETMRDNDSHDD